MKKLIIFLAVILSVILTGCSSDGGGSQGDGDDPAGDLPEIVNIIDGGSDKYQELIDNGGDTASSRTKLVSWLLSTNIITDAGISDDGYSVYFKDTSGINAVILTGDKAPPSSKSLAYKIPKISKHIPSVSSKTRGMQPMNGLPSSTGMHAYLFAPFYTSADEADYIRDNYYGSITIPGIPGLTPDTILPGATCTVYKDEDATATAFAAALMGGVGPAALIEVNSMGGLTKINGVTVAYFLTGQVVDIENYIDNQLYLTLGYLIIVNNYFAIVPAFVENLSMETKTDPDESSWMNRYVHINSDYSYHSSLVDAFVDNGAVSYSGHTGLVTHGDTEAKAFFDSLAVCDYVSLAHTYAFNPGSELSGTNVNSYFFYRSFFTFNGTPMATPSIQWLPVWDVNSTNISDGVRFSSNYSSRSKSSIIVGDISVVFDSASPGTYSISQPFSKIEISVLDENGTSWSADSDDYDDPNLSVAGIVSVSNFEDFNGGVVKGTFSGTLTDHDPDSPNYKHVSGRFNLIRASSFSEDDFNPGGGGGIGGIINPLADGIYADLEVTKTTLDGSFLKDRLTARFDSYRSILEPENPLQAGSVSCVEGGNNYSLLWNNDLLPNYYVYPDPSTTPELINTGATYTFNVTIGNSVPDALTGESIDFPSAMPVITDVNTTHDRDSDLVVDWSNTGNEMITITIISKTETNRFFRYSVIDNASHSFTISSHDLQTLPAGEYLLKVERYNYKNIFSVTGYDSFSVIMARAIDTKEITLQ